MKFRAPHYYILIGLLFLVLAITLQIKFHDDDAASAAPDTDKAAQNQS